MNARPAIARASTATTAAGDEAQASLMSTLAGLDPDDSPSSWFDALVGRGLDALPMPGSGSTLTRWRALASVAAYDLSLVKLFEGHTDALAILCELGAASKAIPGQTWGTWAAEAPGGRTTIHIDPQGHVRLHGAKQWCSGAGHLSHGLLTAWHADGRGPQLVCVAMDQPSIRIDADAWRAVGMAGSASVEVVFDGAAADLVGDVRDYLSRSGFWQGGAGIAACWYGGARALADTLRSSLAPKTPQSPFKLAALGRVDVAMSSLAALLREAAAWIDAHPQGDASALAFRTRLAAEAIATQVLQEVGRALGAAPFCKDARFARMAADLPVYLRQSHADQDLAALGERSCTAKDSAWVL